MISVISPTVRLEGLKLVEKALKRQTYQMFDWIICSKEDPKIYGVKWVKDDFTGGTWSLNRAYNKMIKETQDLIVSWQDYTFTGPETLRKFLYHHELEPKTLVTGVGNKYQDENWQVTTWQDPRKRADQGTFYPCYWNDIEANLSSFPKQAIVDIGGFDEEMDQYYGLDFFNVLNRLNDLGGYDFKIDQTIESYSLEHGRLSKDWDRDNWMANNRYNDHVAKRKTENKWPKLNYLT